MKHYIEITLLPNEEVSLYFLWSKVYLQLHLAMVEQQKSSGVVTSGVAFSEYQDKGITLGSKLRIFDVTEVALKALNLIKWFDKLSDYIHISSIKQVPDSLKGHVIFSRYNSKGTPEKRARRYAKRHDVSFEKALGIYEQLAKEQSSAPFIKLKSLSNGHAYSFMILKSTLTKEPKQKGGFSTYGLSNGKSVPWF